MLVRNGFFIDGSWATPTTSDCFEVTSPSSEEVIGRVPAGAPADVDRAVAAAREAFDHGQWPTLSLAERSKYLLRLQESLAGRLDALVEAQIDEMGAPRRWIGFGTARMIESTSAKVAAAEAVPFREVRPGGAGKVLVLREPIGVVGAIIPWNAPVPMLLAKLVPALLTGNTLVVKPPLESPLSAYVVAEAIEEVGLPDGVVNIVAGDRNVGAHLVGHPLVDKITFTGSTSAGQRVGAVCGELIRSATLELGGKSAAILLDDADLDTQLPLVVNGALGNSGQVCYATSRVLVPASRHDEVAQRLAAAVADLRVGDPHDPDTDVGPLVASRQRDRVEGYIASGLAQGARLAVGGGRPAGLDKGWYVEPTVFVDVDNSMRIAQEEIFGPVVTVIRYDDEDDAVRLANDSPYGLGGAVITNDPERGVAVASRIRTGTCVINDGAPAGGGGPFGGYKRSGIGREYGKEGWDTYLEIKSVSLPPGYDPQEGA
jgi:aldehyde dehydrogenase (NAD+)